jgi:hypothetical protein
MTALTILMQMLPRALSLAKAVSNGNWVSDLRRRLWPERPSV